jgi:hypothetical protein
VSLSKLPYYASPPRLGKTPDGVPAFVVDVAPSRTERRSSRCERVYITQQEAEEAAKDGKSLSMVLAVKVVNAAQKFLKPRADAEVAEPIG